MAAIHRELEAFGRRNMQTSQKEYMDGHMVRLFEEVLVFKPELIVELGVGWGCSNFALGKAAEICGTLMIAVDVKECEVYSGVQFVQMDDLEYAKVWTLGPAIDILMIDTSHAYGQTQQEVLAWFPHLRERCEVIFHDTNTPYFKAVGHFLRDWFDIPLPGEEPFEVKSGDWNVRHYPESNGLTILDRGTE